MVDWERVEALRADGRGWGDIAKDPKVGFLPDPSVGDPGRALHALYRRQGRKGDEALDDPARVERAAERPAPGSGWTLARIGLLTVPLFGIWSALAYLIPSPIGILVPAVPYLVLVLAGAALLLAYGLWRVRGARRWSRSYSKTVAVGVAGGLVVAGLVGLSGGLLLGCPYLPASSRLGASGEGWSTVPASPWKEGGVPVLFFYGATWCPYCSASSWAVWKALTEFGTVSGNATGYSFPYPEPYAYTPEMVLANTHLSSGSIAFQVVEYDGGTDGQLSPTANCVQQAYLSAYDQCSGCGIPFLVVDGQYLHIGSLYLPSGLAPWNRTNNATGAAFVERSVLSESGPPWTLVQGQAWWIMGLLSRSTGQSVPHLAATYGWSAATEKAVWADVNQTS